ncbi:hypothetical protein BHM03_00038107 [Ensete ventricosum]|nr:hypothetical protein BHM03_00038107 [Ensete ventricosum]
MSHRVCSLDGLIWLSSKAQKWLLAEPFHLQHCDTGAEGFEVLGPNATAGSASRYYEKGRWKEESSDLHSSK